ncbi:MAG: metallophosphoesterase [Bacteroidota bacterium]
MKVARNNQLIRMTAISICLIFMSSALMAQTFNEILARPTNNSMTISIMFNQKADVYWVYGTSPGANTLTSPNLIAKADTPMVYEFTNLLPNTKYYFTTKYRTNGSSGSFLSGPEHFFNTQRAVGSSFTFTVEADEHLNDKKGVVNLYKICLENQAKDNPDFMISMGDIFGDDHNPFTITYHQLDSLHKVYRPLLGNICHSIPFYICLGNHEGENDYYLAQTPPNNIATYATLTRKFYYSNPFPNSFYTGNSDNEPNGIGKPENYYAWTWGEALFVVMDVYRDQCDTSPKPTKWNWSIGTPQYTWLKNTLEGSTAKYKFVFAHHVSGQGRGGINQAKLYEWGGYEANGTTWGFTTNRPGWAKPIHQLFVDNGVNIFFQGHDHVFAHEVMDNVIYQSMPMPSDSTYQIGMLANADAYVSDTVDGSGHVRITVTPVCVKVDYIKAYLPADTVSGIHHNREIGFSYTIGDCSTVGINAIKKGSSNQFKSSPNPFSTETCFHFGIAKPTNIKFEISDIKGNVVYTISKDYSTDGNYSIIWDGKSISGIDLPNGTYICRAISNENVYITKVIKLK